VGLTASNRRFDDFVFFGQAVVGTTIAATSSCGCLCIAWGFAEADDQVERQSKLPPEEGRIISYL
jgi:hypothetical protein